MRWIRLAAYALSAILGVGLLTTVCFKGLPGELHYQILSGDGRTIEVVANPRADGMLRLKGIQDKGYSATVLAEEFLKNRTFVPRSCQTSLPGVK